METTNSKSHLIIFRVRSSDGAKLTETMRERKIVGIKSINQFARKVLLDFLEGRLKYANAEDADLNPDL